MSISASGVSAAAPSTFAESGELTLTKHHEGKPPPYTILSHTWVIFCGRQAQRDNLLDFWVDSCYINSPDLSELSESIISMYRWYQQATKCYVYLPDVTALKRDSNGATACSWEDAFRQSRWAPLSDFSVNKRHRWAVKRDTTRPEDKAYCLLGDIQCIHVTHVR
ncbi:hypothetical protein CERZMDRAFT_108562 [Cercospora zeae-maydis SCOH1-5]|uniref:Heterokaryon incompatibility domain-containing protein n=1 Tax=Cercospora zeae-maydis SCOH1-5 TaxID=717836 RepID=A0A6A6FX53_9PEZI|nr:hypothetical protein CERZMDRAFT_108562 [Cercospora zeae-maydis SCOH1-5]